MLLLELSPFSFMVAYLMAFKNVSNADGGRGCFTHHFLSNELARNIEQNVDFSAF